MTERSRTTVGPGSAPVVRADAYLGWPRRAIFRRDDQQRGRRRAGRRGAVVRASGFAWMRASRASAPYARIGRQAGAPDLAGGTIGCRAKEKRARAAGHTESMPAPLIEFPADDPDRARRFWHGVLGVTLTPRPA